MQTDTVLLPGSSGGPILKGRKVVGISEKIKGYIFSDSLTIPSGIGYAIRGEIARAYYRAAIEITEEINE